MASYEAPGATLAEISRLLKDARWGMSDSAFREVLRGVKAMAWEQEAKMDGIRTND